MIVAFCRTSRLSLDCVVQSFLQLLRTIARALTPRSPITIHHSLTTHHPAFSHHSSPTIHHPSIIPHSPQSKTALCHEVFSGFGNACRSRAAKNESLQFARGHHHDFLAAFHQKPLKCRETIVPILSDDVENTEDISDLGYPLFSKNQERRRLVADRFK